MSWNGSEQLEKAMEEVLGDDDDDDDMKVEKSSVEKMEKSSVEKMEKHSNPETQVLEPLPAGIDSWFFRFIYSLLPGSCNQSLSCSFIQTAMHQN